MEKSYVINRIKELCNKKNDREIALDFFYNNRIFHAKYLFLGNDLYVTDTLNVIELKDLDMGVLSRIRLRKIKIWRRNDIKLFNVCRYV